MKESLIYPGEYRPLRNVEALLTDLILSKKDQSVPPLMNMDEYKEYYKLEIAMPGISRDQIIIYLHENILTIAAVNKDTALPEERKSKIHDLDFTPLFHSHIFLPGSVDAEFIFAELEAGVLSIRIPKSTKAELSRGHHVVIY